MTDDQYEWWYALHHSGVAITEEQVVRAHALYLAEMENRALISDALVARLSAVTRRMAAQAVSSDDCPF